MEVFLAVSVVFNPLDFSTHPWAWIQDQTPRLRTLHSWLRRVLQWTQSHRVHLGSSLQGHSGDFILSPVLCDRRLMGFSFGEWDYFSIQPSSSRKNALNYSRCSELECITYVYLDRDNRAGCFERKENLSQYCSVKNGLFQLFLLIVSSVDIPYIQLHHRAHYPDENER